MAAQLTPEERREIMRMVAEFNKPYQVIEDEYRALKLQFAIAGIAEGLSATALQSLRARYNPSARVEWFRRDNHFRT